MRIILTAPFRTAFNLDTDLLVQHYAKGWTFLGACCEAFSKPGEAAARVDLPAPRSNFEKYSTLSEDAISFSSAPVVAFTPSEAQRAHLAGQLRAAFVQSISSAPETADLIVLRSAEIRQFDNTIAVLTCEIDVDPAILADISALDGVDATTSDFARHATASSVATVIDPFMDLCRARQAGWSGSGAEPLLKAEADFVAFDDLSEHLRGASKDRRSETLIWSQRTIILEAGEAPIIRRVLDIAQVDEAIRERVEGQPSWHIIREGTCLLYNHPFTEDFISALHVIQYYAALFDTLNDALKRIYARLSSQLASRKFDAEIRRANHISAFLDFFMCEYKDYSLFGAQAHRRVFANKLSEAYNIDEILANLTRRENAVSTRVQRLLEARSVKLQRGVEAALVGIAGVALVDLTLNLGLETREPGAVLEESAPGPIALLSHAPLDATLAVLLLSLVGLSILYYRRRA